MSKQNLMKQLRDIREKVSADIVGMDLKELQAYLKAKGSLAAKKPVARAKKPVARAKRARVAIVRKKRIVKA